MGTALRASCQGRGLAESVAGPSRLEGSPAMLQRSRMAGWKWG